MLLIISEEDDKTTNEVMLWLFDKGLKPIRINSNDNIRINKIEINLRDVSSVWYRGASYCIFFAKFISRTHRKT